MATKTTTTTKKTTTPAPKVSTPAPAAPKAPAPALPKATGSGSTALSNALAKATVPSAPASKPMTPAPAAYTPPPAPKQAISQNQASYLNTLVSQGGGNAAWAKAQLANSTVMPSATTTINKPSTTTSVTPAISPTQAGGSRPAVGTSNTTGKVTAPAPAPSSYNATQAVKNAVAAITSGNAPTKAPVMQNAPVINKPIAQAPKPAISNPRLQGMPSNVSAARINATQTAASTAAQRRSDLSSALFGEEYYPEAVRKGGIPAMVAYDLSGAIPGVGTAQAGVKASQDKQLGLFDWAGAIPLVGGGVKAVGAGVKGGVKGADAVVDVIRAALKNQAGEPDLVRGVYSLAKGATIDQLTLRQKGAIERLFDGKMPSDKTLQKVVSAAKTPTPAPAKMPPSAAEVKSAANAISDDVPQAIINGTGQAVETAAPKASTAVDALSALLKGEVTPDNKVLENAITNLNKGVRWGNLSKTQQAAVSDAMRGYLKTGEKSGQALINAAKGLGKTTQQVTEEVVGNAGKVTVDEAGETVVKLTDKKVGGVDGTTSKASTTNADEIAKKVNAVRKGTVANGPDTTATRTTAYSGRTGDNVVRQPDTGGMRVDPRTGKVSWQNPTNPKFKGGEWVAGTPKLGDALRGADAGAATKAALAGAGIAGATGAYNYFQENPLDIQFGADAATQDAQTYEQQVLTEFGLLEPTTTDAQPTYDALTSAATYAAPRMMSASAGTGIGATSYGGGPAAGTGATTSGGGYTAAGAAQETGGIERDYYVADPNGGWTQMTGYFGPDGLMYTDAAMTQRIPDYAYVPKLNADGTYATDENGMDYGWQLIGGQGVPVTGNALQMPEALPPEMPPEMLPEEIPTTEEEAQMSVFDEIMAQLEPYIQSQYAAVDAETEANIQRMREELAARGILNSDLVVSMEMDLRDQGEAQKDEIYAGIVKDAMTQAYQYAALEQDQTQFQQTYDQTERNNAARLEAEYAALEADERKWLAQNNIDLAKLDIEERKLALDTWQAKNKSTGSSSKESDQYTLIANTIMTAAENAIFNGITDPAVIKSYMNNAAARFSSIPAGLMQSLQANVANTLISQSRLKQ